MSHIKLIALDLDGTLLNSEKKISPRNLAAIRAAQEKGVKVVLTTGRPLKAMDFLLQEIGTAGLSDEFTITFNGGLVQKNTGEIIAKTVFSRDDVLRIYEETEALGLPLDAISEGDVYTLASDQESLYPFYNPYLNFIPVSIEDLSSQISYNKCVTAFHPLTGTIWTIKGLSAGGFLRSLEVFGQYGGVLRSGFFQRLEGYGCLESCRRGDSSGGWRFLDVSRSVSG